MRKFLITCFLIILTQNVHAEDKQYIIDDSHFSLGFLVEHAGYAKTLGLFKHIDGSFIYNADKNTVKDILITVNTDSVFTNHEKRDAHLRSPDFLNVSKYPVMTFSSDFTDLNIRIGLTKPIVMGVSGNAKFRRSDFGMTYGVSKNLVGDMIELIVEFEAIQQ